MKNVSIFFVFVILMAMTKSYFVDGMQTSQDFKRETSKFSIHVHQDGRYSSSGDFLDERKRSDVTKRLSGPALIIANQNFAGHG